MSASQVIHSPQWAESPVVISSILFFRITTFKNKRIACFVASALS